MFSAQLFTLKGFFIYLLSLTLRTNKNKLLLAYFLLDRAIKDSTQ